MNRLVPAHANEDRTNPSVISVKAHRIGTFVSYRGEACLVMTIHITVEQGTLDQGESPETYIFYPKMVTTVRYDLLGVTDEGEQSGTSYEKVNSDEIIEI
jgi:hypothetical protein